MPSNTQVAEPVPVSPPALPLLERFSSELEALGGTIVTCSSAEVADLVLDFLRQRGITRIQAWEGTHLMDGLLEHLDGGGIQIQLHPDPEITAGLTGADGAIAETGTLVLTDAPGRPIIASLLPEIHVALLPASKVYEAMPEALQLPDIRQSTLGALISGPSRTADIEMTLTIGVHGPREVHVFCLTDR